MATAATQPPAPTGLFTFMKHGVLLPARNRGFLPPIFVLTAVLAATLLHSSLTEPPGLLVDAISRADPRGAAYPVLVEGIRGDLRRTLVDVGVFLIVVVPVYKVRVVKLFMYLVVVPTVLSDAFHLFKCLVLAAGAAIGIESVSVPYLVATTVGSATYIATVFAAVASRSSGAASPSSFLRMVRGNLLQPVLTAALSGALKLACGAMVAYNPLPEPVLDKVVIFLALLLYACVEFVFRVAVVASVAESGRCGRGSAGAAGRAWQLMQRGKYEEAGQFASWLSIIRIPFRLVHSLALQAGFPRVAASGVMPVDAGVMCLLLMAEEMLWVERTTAYYFECEKIEEMENKAGHAD